MSVVVPQPTLSFLRFVVAPLRSGSPLPHKLLLAVKLNIFAGLRWWWGGACSAFSLEGNQIGDVGAEALARAVHANTSLETLE